MTIVALFSPCAVIFLLIMPGLGLAQSQSPSPAPAPINDQEQKKESETWPRSPESMEHEVQVRAELEIRKSERRKALEAANELLTLARRLKASATGGERVNAPETLESIQKLAKRIRSYSGGGESDQDLKKVPANLQSGAEQIVTIAEELKRELEKLDHHVISVTIIDGTNTIIQLSDYLREQARSVGS